MSSSGASRLNLVAHVVVRTAETLGKGSKHQTFIECFPDLSSFECLLFAGELR